MNKPIIGKLVLVEDDLYINVDHMASVSRNGNDTVIKAKGIGLAFDMISVWDQNKTLWNRIQLVITNEQAEIERLQTENKNLKEKIRSSEDEFGDY